MTGRKRGSTSNPPAHKIAGVREVIRGAGASLLLLPL